MKFKNIRFIFITCFILLLSWAVCFADDATTTSANRIINPSFEKDPTGKNFTVSDWTIVSDQDKDAAFTESRWTHSGQNKFTNWKDSDFKVYTYQTVQNLAEGVYNFEFWYANGEGANDCHVELKDFGGDTIKISITRSGKWIKVEFNDIKITSGKCTIGIYSDGKAGYWINMDDFALYNQKDMPAGTPTTAAAKAKKKEIILNGGFENGDGKTLSDWQVVSDKDKDASYRENNWAHTDDYKLTNKKDQDYQVYTYQTLSKLKKDTYVLEFWYCNGGEQKDCYVEIKDFGGKTIKETLPISPTWWKVTIPNIVVTTGKCTIGINTNAKAQYWINLDDFQLVPDDADDVYADPEQLTLPVKEFPMPIKGIDLSTLPQVEAGGGNFYDLNGDSKDVFDILKENGVNYVRLRIWNDPRNGICGEASTLAMAKRIKKAGMGFLLDFHYSDTWADPGKQEKPAAWKSLDFAGLNKAVYQYTQKVITDLKNQKTMPDMVQIGNEIRGGMLYPDGKLTNVASFDKLAQLLKSGVQGVQDASKGQKIKIVLHLDNGGDNGAYTYFFDNLIAKGVQFDVIGLSYYNYWHGNMTGLYDNMSKLAQKYNKELVIAETGFPFTVNEGDGLENLIPDDNQLRKTGYVPTIAGQKRFLEELINVIKHTPYGKGLGLFYWEGAWLPVEGAGWDPNKPDSKNAWENQCLFNFDGFALDSLKAFSNK
jgi:arabinogalactan endo-1,4-beta-galactosidase